MHDGYALESQVGTVLDGLGFRKEDWTRLHRRVLRRLADAHRAGQAAAVEAQPAAARRADQPPRSRSPQLARAVPAAVSLRLRPDLARPLLPRRHRRPHRRDLEQAGVTFYSGNYEKYLPQKHERRDSLVAAYKNQRDRIEQLEAFINRFRSQATKAKQVQSRIKELEKIERIEVPPDEKTIHFTFPQPKPSGRTWSSARRRQELRAEGRLQRRELHHPARRPHRAGRRQRRRQVDADQAAGRRRAADRRRAARSATTSSRTISRRTSTRSSIPTRRMLDDLSDVAPQKSTTELRSMLGCFLFSEDDVFKPIGVLSGGERNRYALARMLLHPSNFLLLDEPTNHLDMRAKDVLLEALEKYNGTVVFVSHDRYFIDKLATRVFEIGNGRVEVFPGNYEDYLWRKQRADQAKRR